MADPNTNTAANLSKLDQPFGHPDSQVRAKPATEPGDIIEMTSLMHANTPEETNFEFTSIAQRKAPIEMQLAEEYANRKGIPVRVYDSNGFPVEGRLIEWTNDSEFRVVWKENGALITEVFNAGELYEIKGNERVKGAVEFCRANANEILAGRKEILDRLTTIDEKPPQAA
ncbi:hypothetical protein JXD20_00065 [Candidatus Peregrinibacteria bacterium]|nr:hypothetical protein [Candidatus Peregrinibacteria bacterium]